MLDPAASAPPALPDEIVQALAIANANAIGAQPAILANLALANQIFNANLQQQAAIATQQAVNLVTLAAIARCVQVIATDSSPGQPEQLQELVALLRSIHPPAATAPAASTPAT